jgi:hypothetical protein
MKRFGWKTVTAAVGLLLWIPMLILIWHSRSADPGAAALLGKSELEIVKEADRKLLNRRPPSDD